MAQALADILAQLDPVYAPQKQAVQQQIGALPDQEAADQAGLDTAKTNAFSDINTQANDRGLSYSGMPISEEAKYTGATYLPAVANLKNTYAGKASALQQSLLGLSADEQKQAQSTYATEYAADQDAAAKVAAAKASAAANPGLDLSSLLGGGASGSTAAPTIQDHLNADIQNLIPKDYATKFLPGYTEREITRLQQAYPELAPNAVASAVYAYRKQVAGT